MKIRWDVLTGATVAAVFAFASFGTTAKAGGDFDPKAPSSWTGIYAGGHIGYLWGNLDWQYVNPAGPTGALNLEPEGRIAGVHIGFQKQWGNIVLGLEGAYTDTSSNDRGPDSPAFAATFDSRTSIQRILSIGPRVGWAFDKAMVYGTGGYAQASILTSDIVKATNTDNFKDTNNHHGWFLGAGVEFKLHSSWVLGIEYLHYDFGSERHFSPGGAIIAGGTRDIEVDADVVRARLSYRLGQ